MEKLFAAMIGFLLLGAGARAQDADGYAWDRIALHRGALGGEIGRRIDLEVKQNFLALDLENDFLRPFLHRRPTPEVLAHFGDNAIELGENLDAAVWLAWYTRDPRVIARKEFLIGGVERAQAADGYIGVFVEEPRARQLFRNYAIEESAYLIVGLADNYRLFGDGASLAAARKLADFMIGHWADRPAGVKFSTVGLSQGFLAMFAATHDPRYLHFAAEVPGGGMFNDPAPLRLWNQAVYPTRPLDYPGARIVTRVLPHGLYPDNPAYTFPSDRVHVYALLERTLSQMQLDRLEPSPDLWLTPRRVLRGLTDRLRPALLVTGAAGFLEGWDENQEGRGPVGETCASVHLVWFFEAWLRRTGDLRFGDLMERTIYNTLFAAQDPAGRRLRYFTAFSGERRYFELDTYCCPGNFRRGLGLLPSMVYYRRPGAIAVNLYTDSTLTDKLADGAELTLREKTDYPTGNRVDFVVTPSRPERFSLRLRIPRWCRNPTVSVDGVPVFGWSPGMSDWAVDRKWKPGDRVALVLPMAWRLIRGRGMQTGRATLMRGPLVYGLNPDRNPDLRGIRLRDLTLDPNSLGEIVPDRAVRPDGTSVVVMAWDPAAVVTAPGDAERKRLDRANAGAPTAGRGPASRRLLFTEFTDPGGAEIYFRVPPGAALGDDELLQPLPDSVILPSGHSVAFSP